MSMPKLEPLGKCLGCGRILISNVYSLCWRCATTLVDGSTPSQGHADRHPQDFVERLYSETGGEG